MNVINSETDQIIERIIQYCQPEKIILFGSVARNDIKENSDIDLLIIKESDIKRPFRVKEIFTALRGMVRNYPLDAIVYTPEELDKRILIGDYFIKRILSEGRTVYGD